MKYEYIKSYGKIKKTITNRKINQFLKKKKDFCLPFFFKVENKIHCILFKLMGLFMYY